LQFTFSYYLIIIISIIFFIYRLVDFKELSGSHITPLTPNLLFDLSKLIENSELSFLKFVSSPLLNLLNPKRSKVLRDVMKTIDDTNQEIIQFLDVNVKNS